MADKRITFHTPSAGVTIGVATGVTVLQVLAAANTRTKINGVTVGLKGTVNTNPPVKIRLLYQTSAGTVSTGAGGGSSVGGAATPSNINAVSETILASGQFGTFLTEPTNAGESAVIWEDTVQPQLNGGIFWPQGKEPIIPGGGRVGLEITDPSSVAVVVASIDLEE